MLQRARSVRGPYLVGVGVAITLIGAFASACSQSHSDPKNHSPSAIPYQTNVDAGAVCGGPDAVVCPSKQYCDYGAAANACGANQSYGVCRTSPQACPFFCAPACGCNNVTYDNGCWPEHFGVSIAYAGFCRTSPAVPCWTDYATLPSCNIHTGQQDCNGDGNDAGNTGGPIGESNMYCPIAPDGGADSMCAFIPNGCSDASGPVCGVNGLTYASECSAYWEGRVGIAHPGACADNNSDAGNSDAGDLDAGTD